MVKERVTFQKIIKLLDSTGQQYELISTEEDFNKQCKDTFPYLAKLEFKCVSCGEKTYKSYNSLLVTKHIGFCRKCAMKIKSTSLSKSKKDYDVVYKVYKLTSLDTNKSYIGVTSCNVEQRWAKGNGYCKQKYLYSDILKYGWNRITKEILYECNSFTESREKERYYIDFYNTIHPNGYNVLKGTFNICCDGKDIIDICQINLNGEIVHIWKNVLELEGKYSLNQIRTIRNCLFESKLGNLLTSKGYFWVLKENINKYKKDDFINVSLKNKNQIKSFDNKPKLTYQYDENKKLVNIYKSRRDITRKNPEFKKTAILSHIKSGKIYKGFYWSYELFPEYRE